MNQPLKQGIKLPHVFIFLSLIILVAAISTYFIPSGSFQRIVKELDGVSQTIVVPNTYASIPKHYSVEGMILADPQDGKATPVSLLGLFTAIPKGMAQSAGLIFFIFTVGAVFSLIQETGAVSAVLYKLMVKFNNSPVLLPAIIFTAIAIGSTTLGMSTEFIPMIPLFLLVSKQLGYDRLFGVSFLLMADGIGWAAGVTNPFNLQIAQQVAELPIGSGILFRVMFFVVCFAIGLNYFLRYGRKVKKDPLKSGMKGDAFELENISELNVKLTRKHKYILASAFILFCMIIYSVQALGWGLFEMSGGFLAVGVVTIFINRIPGDEAMKSMIKGMELMIVPALIVGVARGIQVVMVEGQIIDTLLNHAAGVLQHQPKLVATYGMLIFQSSFNFLIPSASGQALVTMPLMVPLADLLNISRQLTVFIFVIGDGLSNIIIPTNGFLLAVLGIAGVPFDKWFKFILPLFLQLFLAGIIFIYVGYLLNY